MKVLRTEKKWVNDYRDVLQQAEDLEVLLEFYKADEVEASELTTAHEKLLGDLEEIEFRNMLSEEGDALSAVVQITAGAGGTESCDWAAMLMRMYLMWGEKQGFKIKELNHQAGDVAGIKTVTLEIDGDFAFGWLKEKTASIDWFAFHRLTAMPNATLRLFLCTYILWSTTVLRLLSIPQTSLGRPCDQAERAVRVLTRLKRLFACGTLLRASSSKILKRVPNWKIKPKPCSCSNPNCMK